MPSRGCITGHIFGFFKRPAGLYKLIILPPEGLSSRTMSVILYTSFLFLRGGWMSVRIVVFTGPSGSGKTTLTNELLKGSLSYLLELIVSTTTRAPRPSDLLGEYEYKTGEGFEMLKRFKRFLWSIKLNDTWYGTRKEAVDTLLQKLRKIGLMILKPEKVLELKNYVGKNYPRYSVWAIYIESPGAAELERRMIKQGRSEKEIQMRLQTDSSWDEMARQMGIFDEFIPNNKNDGGAEASICVANRILAFSKDLPR